MEQHSNTNVSQDQIINSSLLFIIAANESYSLMVWIGRSFLEFWLFPCFTQFSSENTELTKLVESFLFYYELFWSLNMNLRADHGLWGTKLNTSSAVPLESGLFCLCCTFPSCFCNLLSQHHPFNTVQFLTGLSTVLPSSSDFSPFGDPFLYPQFIPERYGLLNFKCAVPKVWIKIHISMRFKCCRHTSGHTSYQFKC